MIGRLSRREMRDALSRTTERLANATQERRDAVAAAIADTERNNVRLRRELGSCRAKLAQVQEDCIGLRARLTDAERALGVWREYAADLEPGGLAALAARRMRAESPALGEVLGALGDPLDGHDGHTGAFVPWRFVDSEVTQ